MAPVSTMAWPAPVDDLGRRFGSLRLSLTARCNFACSYCVPDAKRLLPAKSELRAPEFAHLLQLLLARGIDRLRITGGEPLLSDELLPLLDRIEDWPFSDKALTSNGTLLAGCAEALATRGIGRINLSLDSLDAERFRRMSRGGDLERTLKGLQAALAAGMRVRVNCVLVRGENDGEILPLLDFCAAKGVELRFIELMRMGHLHADERWRQLLVPQAEILATVARQYSFQPAPTEARATARRWRLDGGAHFGIIANSSQPFCAGCDRLRLTSNGLLYGCIGSAEGFDLRPLLDLPEEQAQERLDWLLGRALATKSRRRFDGQVTVMKFLGG